MWSNKTSRFLTASSFCFSKLLRNSAVERTGPAFSRSRRLKLEPLEERALLSAAPLFSPGDDLLTPALYDGELTPGGDSPVTGTSVMVFDNYRGTWSDAEKDATSTEDDLLCWAAVASNMLEWTGWGMVAGMTRTDQFFDYFEEHWTDEGGLPMYAIEWWLNGTNGKQGDLAWSQVDVNGGNFYPAFDYTTYYEFDSNSANVMDHIADWTDLGWGMGLSLRGGGLAHEVTCWGYNYDPADPDYYVGVWISDSDNDKGVADGHLAPNELHYYAIDWNSTDNHWSFDAYSAGSHLGYCTGLEQYSNGIVTLNGDQDAADQADAINVALDATGMILEVEINGNLRYSGPLSAVSELNVLGWGGNDTLTVDFTNGDPLAGMTFNYDGGAGGDDALIVIGNGGIGSYLPASIVGDGVVTIGESVINFTGLEPVLVDGFAEFTFVTPNSNDVLTIDSPLAGQNRITGTSGGAAFEALTFTNVVNFKIDTAANDNPLANPNDLVTFTSDLVAAGLTSFTVDLGAGNDTADATVVANIGVTLLGGDGDDVLAAGGGANILDGGSGADTLTARFGSNIMRGGEDGDTIIVHGTAQSFSVEGGGGNDMLFLNAATGAAETIAIAPKESNPTQQTVAWLASASTIAGVERIRYTGTGTDDVLTVNTGPGTVRATTTAGPFGGDVFISTCMPDIEFTGLNWFEVAVGNGVADIVFDTTLLWGNNDDYRLIQAYGDTNLVIQGAEGANDAFTVTNPTGSDVLAVTHGGKVVTATSGAAALGQLRINSLGGDDFVTVDVNTGLISVPIMFDGGAGSDALVVLGDPAQAEGNDLDQVEYFPGTDVLEGRLLYDLDWTTPDTHEMMIDFINLEPVVDLTVAAVAVTVYGTNADNAINYTDGPHGGVVHTVLNPLGVVTGTVSVDAYETFEFANKQDVLEIIGLAGDDVINLNYQNAVPPVGLARIWVEGSDPTGSDKVVVNGTPGQDTIVVTPTGADSADVTVNGFLTQVWTAESLVINGLGGDDSLTVIGTAADDYIVVAPGAAIDAGGVRVGSLLPLDYRNLGAAGSLSIDGAGGADDELAVLGTAVDEAFNVAANTAEITVVQNGTSIPLRLPLNHSNMELLAIYAMEGDDDFVMNGPVPAGLRMITLSGGDPSGSDTATLLDTANPIEVRLGAYYATVSSVGLGSIALPGVETVSLGAGAQDIAVMGTSDPYRFEVTPRGPNEATVQIAGAAPVVYTSNTGQLNIVGGGTPGDTLAVNLSHTDETVTVTGSLVQVTAGALLKAVNYSGMESLVVNGRAGDDTFNVSPAAIPIFIDGGDPIGVLPGDRLVLDAGGGAVTFAPGPENDEGGFDVETNAPVSFDHIESVAVVNPGLVTVFGTDAEDNITVIARDGSYDAGADGIQDFTVAVNDGPAVLYLNAASLAVYALGCSDEIAVQTPAPNLAVWNVALTIDGGLPTASDKLIVGTPGTTDTVTYAPTGPDSGTLTIANLNTVFNISQIEHLVYDGEAGNDDLTVLGTAAVDTFVHTPGEAVDAGVVRVNSLLPINYQNLGANGYITIDDSAGETADLLICEGTAREDTFNVAAATGAVTLETAIPTGYLLHIPINQIDVERLELDGLEGDDHFNLTSDLPYSMVFLAGGGPGGSDSTTILGTVGVDDDFAFYLGSTHGEGTVVLNAIPVTYKGLEEINLLGDPPDLDTLQINGSLASEVWEILRGSLLYGTQVQIDQRETVNYGQFVDTEVRPDSIGIGGDDRFRVHPAYIPNITVTGSGVDVLEIIGTNMSDAVLLNDGIATLSITSTFYSGISQLNVIGLEGDDIATVDVDGTPLIAVPIMFDGGVGSDTLRVVGTPLTGATAATYSPGPAEGEGRVQHLGGAATMTIDFANLEPVIDLVPGTLTVNGTNANNAINYVQGSAAANGQVSVDNFEPIEFSNKTDLTINAGALDDQINLNNASLPTGLATITVNAGEGNDRVVMAGLPAPLAATVNGGFGDDFIDGTLVPGAVLILYGNEGNDVLKGGAAGDTINGGDGDDTMVGGGGNNTFDGGAGFDTILIPGTSGDDVIDVNQTAAGALVNTVNGNTQTDALVLSAGVRTVESARIEAGDGDDLIRVSWLDALGVDGFANSLRFDVYGGAAHTRDRLAVVDDGVGDLLLYRKGESDSTGSITVGPVNAEPLEMNFEGIEYAEPLPAADGQVAVFKHDPYEYNNDRLIATHLGSAATINIDPTIDPGPAPVFGLPGDQDWYRVEALQTGTLDFQVFFSHIAAVPSGRPGLPGDGDLDIAVYDSTGDFIAGSAGMDDDERVRIPAVQGQIYYLRVYGFDTAVNNYSMTIINEPAPVPYDIELLDFPVGDPPPANSDTGRSNTDNITRDNTPTLIFRLDDGFFLNDLPGNDLPNSPPNGVIVIPFQAGPVQPAAAGFAIGIFDEGPAPNSPPQTPLGFAMQIEPGVYAFTTPVLADGSHFLSARVQMIDPANPTETGWGDRSLSLEIVVDTVVPPVSFGDPAIDGDGLAPDSDTGVSPPNPDTISDDITSDTTPKFWGRAEADAILRLYADVNDNGVLDIGTDVFLGQTTAIPLDGNLQEPDGYWEIQTIVDLNDPAYFPIPDGLRTIFVTAEDVAGNVNAPDGAGDLLEIFIDTQGPVIDAVFVTDAPGYDLFDPKPSTDGPSPLVGMISITFTDPPDREDPFLYPALKMDVAAQPGHYLLVGDANGAIAIQSVTVLNDPVLPGQPATATVVLTFFDFLPDDRFTLTISDSLTDPAGNHLDGENNAVEPQEQPLFPTGDGVPGGEFVARFTVDSRPEIGTWSAGTVYLDTNGNFLFDPQNLDATNRDLVYVYGFTSDNIFAGNFGPMGAAVADGFAKLGAYGRIGNQYRWLIDSDNNGAADIVVNEPANINGMPIAGNFSGVPGTADQVGLFDGSNWYFDVDHDYQIDLAATVPSLITGYPIVGDFDGDGHVDLGTYRDDVFYFQLWDSGINDYSTSVKTITTLGLIGVRERPVAADMDQDGITDIGLWAPDRSGATGDNIGEWYFLLSNDHPFDTSGNPLPTQRIAGEVNMLNHQFSQAPLGNDLFARMGNQYAMPLVGNFDPPVNPTTVPQNIGPAIYSVVTAVSGDDPVITWTLEDFDGIASTTLSVDGRTAKVYGPYGTNTRADYAGVLAELNLAPGSHTFVITATDAAGTPLSTQYHGAFEMPAQPSGNTGPVISSVVKAVAGDDPVITWNLKDADGIAATTLTVDGRTVKVYGPYGTKTNADYAGVLAGLNLAPGSHTFVITATDAAGKPVSTQLTGTFEMPAQPSGNTGPVISSVVKAVAGDNPVITWNLKDADGIAATTLTVDGRTAKVYGPYGTKTNADYAGVLAGLNLAPGSHTFVITTTDAAGKPVSTQFTGTFELVAPAQLAPMISNIIVTELQGNGDKTLQAGETILVTWSANDQDGIFSTGAFINNVAAKAVYGPYGSDYSAVFDPLPSGIHNLTIRAVDKSKDRVETRYDAQFNIAVAQVMAQLVNAKSGSAKTSWLFDM